MRIVVKVVLVDSGTKLLNWYHFPKLESTYLYVTDENVKGTYFNEKCHVYVLCFVQMYCAHKL